MFQSLCATRWGESDVELTCTSGTTGSIGGQHGGRLSDGQVLAVDGEVQLGGLGIDEAEVRGGYGLGEEHEGLCWLREL